MYLSVKEAVDEGDEEALEVGEEVRGEDPDGEEDHVVSCRLKHDDEVGQSQQWQQNDGRFHRFPESTVISPRSSHVHSPSDFTSE